MNFLALLLGLMVERLLTRFFHWREFNWLDPLFDRFFQKFHKKNKTATLLVSIVLVLLLISPVVILFLGLQDRLAHIPLFGFSVFVLLFCLGPRDLGEEVRDYRRAIAEDDSAELKLVAADLLEYASEAEEKVPDIEYVIYAQANNRIFGVVFWFAVLGPVGAWLFRVLDLMRHRSVHFYTDSTGHQYATQSLQLSPVVTVAIQLHQIFAWIPSRLLMISYALAGNYDGAVHAWRNPPLKTAELFPGNDEKLVGAIGCGAARPPGFSDQQLDASARAQVAIDLVIRSLWMIWCPILALLTIYGAIN
jgi:AmpE protein